MNSSNFKYFISTNVTFGNGTRHQLLNLIEQESWKCLALIVDPNLMSVPIIQDLIRQINDNVKDCLILKGPKNEPSYYDLENLRLSLNDKTLDAVIGIGGGSIIDTAKGLAVLSKTKQAATELKGFNKFKGVALPIIAVPTTAGTGTEITPNASFVDTKVMQKMGINGDFVRPYHSFLDPELTLSCPLKPTISAAVDSLVHATEAYVAKSSNELARIFAKEGFTRVYNALQDFTKLQKCLNLRTELMFGAFLSGIALAHSGTGPSGAMSYPLGVHYNVPHGIGGGIFLPFVVEHNISNGFEGYGGLLFEDTKSSFRKVNSQDFICLLTELFAKLGIPNNLLEFNIDKQLFVIETLKLQNALDQNPVHFGRADILDLLNKLCVA